MLISGFSSGSFFFDGDSIALTFNEDSLPVRRYVWNPVTGDLLTDERASWVTGEFYGIYWAANDHLGSVRELLDEQATIAEHREYDSFGGIDAVFSSLGGSRPVANMFSDVAHAGRMWDDDADLYYNNARWYDPAAGRFINEDPARDGSNWYAYAGNDPINFYDPTGLTQAGNPLNNLSLYAFGGYSGGKIQNENTALKNAFFNPVTVNANPLPSLFGPIQTNSTASRSTTNLLGPVNSQADYDRKYGVPAGPSLGSNNLLNSNIFGAPTAKPGSTVLIPEHRRGQDTPEVRYAAYKRQQASSAAYHSQLEALDRQAAQRAAPVPTLRWNGSPVPGLSAQTPYEANVSRLQYLQQENDAFRLISGTSAAREYERLQLATAGPLERQSIIIGAFAGFAGGYQASSGTLNVTNQPPTQVRTVPAGRLKPGPKTDPNAPHNRTIRVQADLLEAGGNTILAGGGRYKETLILTPGGVKSGRRPDILFQTPTGQIRGRNIGRVDSLGNPKPRELDALRDLNGPGGLPTDFVPFEYFR